MKLLFKLFFLFFCALFTSFTLAGSAILITYDLAEKEATHIENLFLEKGIPHRLIEKKWMKNPCLPQKENLLHLCLNEKKEMQISYMKKNEIQRFFNTFANPKKGILK
ncbi:MAG: hypothetical protein KBD63_07830 [Bacteriovoracaceae bacterium]|nr:hypothetical protein [Bacteriovoracaceae bacterium]